MVQTMRVKLSESTIKRLKLVKFELLKVQQYTETEDEYEFSLSISLLHDALENLFWVIEDTHNVGFKNGTDFIQKYDRIVDKLNSKVALNRANVNELNTLRAGFKHHGIIPNINYTRSIVNKIISNTNETIQNIYEISYEQISLAMIIKDNNLKSSLLEIEKKLESSRDKGKDKYKEALYMMGLVFFKFHESHELTGILQTFKEIEYQKSKTRPPKYKILNKNHNSLNLELLELGVTPYTYYRFKNIVPEFVIDSNTGEFKPKYPIYWSKENWTTKNAYYFLDWLINFFIKKESLYRSGNYHIEYSTSNIQILMANYDYKTEFRGRLATPNHVVKFEKSKKYLGRLSDYVEGTWQDYAEPSEEVDIVLYTDQAIIGKVPKNLFSVSETYVDEVVSSEWLLLKDNTNSTLR